MDAPTLPMLAKFHNVPALFTLLICLLFQDANAQDVEIRIGLRAHKGIESSYQSWQPTADYLSEKIPGYRFTMLPYAKIDELTEAAGRHEFDFVLTNPSSYVEIELLFGGSRILTLKNKRGGKGYTQFGSVIFTLANRADINTFSDIAGKRVMAVSKPAFGGWRVAWRELLRNGINPDSDLKSLLFAGGNQKNVVNSIIANKADIGIVRTDMLERLEAQGLINLQDFKIIGKKTVNDFPFLLSTALYPEWPMLRMQTTPLDLAEKVTATLLQMPASDPAAITGHYVGWSVALNYNPVHNLLKELKVGPYKNYGELSIAQIFEKYRLLILSICLFIFILLGVTWYALRINTKLRKAKAILNRNQLGLEEKVLIHAKHLSQANTHFETIVSSIYDGVLTVDSNHRIVTMNPAIEDMFGYTRGELLQNNIDKIIPGLYTDDSNELRIGMNKSVELDGVQKSQRKFPVEIRLAKTSLDGLTMYVGVIRDITERKHLDRMKDEFVSTVSHELRTPLTSINGSLSLILGGVVGEIPAPVRELIVISSRNTDRLLRLISDILDFNKFKSGSGSFELRPINVSTMLGNAIKLHSGYGEKNNIRFKLTSCDTDISIHADEHRIQQVLSNLLSNAVKFSDPNTTVEINAIVIDKKVRISVTDCGKGIDKADQQSIFEKFTQVDASDSRSEGGTGLGLNISKLIVEQHGSSIHCDSELNKGSTFYFELPIMKVACNDDIQDLAS